MVVQGQLLVEVRWNAWYTASFQKDTEEMLIQSRNDLRAKVDYLADIVGKLNVLNSELHWKNVSLYDANKMRIYNATQMFFGDWISAVSLDSLHVTTIISNHLHPMVEDVTQRLSDFSAMDFSDWLTHFSLVDLCDVNPFLRDELADLQNDASMATINWVKRQLMWLNHEIQEKHPKLADKAANFLYSSLTHIWLSTKGLKQYWTHWKGECWGNGWVALIYMLFKNI